MTTADVLSLPRSEAFAQGLLLPVAPWRRRQVGIPFPVRLTVAAWMTLVAFPGVHGGTPDPRTFDTRLDRLLQGLANAIANVGAVTFSERTMHVALPSWIGPPRSAAHHLSMVVVTNLDEEGQDTLTVMTPLEAYSL
jgi:hypothetical protein